MYIDIFEQSPDSPHAQSVESNDSMRFNGKTSVSFEGHL